MKIEVRIYNDPVVLPSGLPFAPGEDDLTAVITAQEIKQVEAATTPAMLLVLAERLNCPSCLALEPAEGAIEVYHEAGFTHPHLDLTPEEHFQLAHDTDALRRKYRGDNAAVLTLMGKLALNSSPHHQDRSYRYHATAKVACLCGSVSLRHFTQDVDGAVWEYAYAHPEERLNPAANLRWWQIWEPDQPVIRLKLQGPQRHAPRVRVSPIGSTAEPLEEVRRAALTALGRLAHIICPGCLAPDAWNGPKTRPQIIAQGDTVTLRAACRWGHSPNHGAHGERMDRYPGSYRCPGGIVEVPCRLSRGHIEKLPVTHKVAGNEIPF